MALRRFIIERDIPKVGTFEREQLRAAAAKSNEVLQQLGSDIQMGRELRGRQQDLLRLSRQRPEHHQRACADQRLSCHQDHGNR